MYEWLVTSICELELFLVQVAHYYTNPPSMMLLTRT